MFEKNAWRWARNVKPKFWAYLTSLLAITLPSDLHLALAFATFSKTRFSAEHMNQTSECLSFALHSKMFNNSHTLHKTMSTFHFFTSLAPSAHLLGQCHVAGQRTPFRFDFTPNESFVFDLCFQVKLSTTPESVETSAEAFDWIVLDFWRVSPTASCLWLSFILNLQWVQVFERSNYALKLNILGFQLVFMNSTEQPHQPIWSGFRFFAQTFDFWHSDFPLRGLRYRND